MGASAQGSPALNAANAIHFFALICAPPCKNYRQMGIFSKQGKTGKNAPKIFIIYRAPKTYMNKVFFRSFGQIIVPENRKFQAFICIFSNIMLQYCPSVICFSIWVGFHPVSKARKASEIVQNGAPWRKKHPPPLPREGMREACPISHAVIAPAFC